MIRLFAETWLGLKATLNVFSLREGWENQLNVSATGFVRSFGAALISLPLLVFIIFGFERFYVEAITDYESTLTLSQIALQFVQTWLVFPVIAYILTRLTGTGPRFVPWVVLHNWSVVFLLLLLGFLISLYLAGLSSIASTGFSIAFIYEGIRYYLYFRVAQVTLGLPLLWTIPMAAIPIVANRALAMLIY
ncbi:hypothetical protein [Hyphobacterium sp.]|uniref:hypothetical protein n=1 Tax=Hyphobacterium sp. TaxID=2004662 RepID=UPI003BACFD8F